MRERSCDGRSHANTSDRVTVDVVGREQEGEEVQTKPLHKKNPEVGDKKMVFSSKLILDQEDAASFGDNEEVGIWYPDHG